MDVALDTDGLCLQAISIAALATALGRGGVLTDPAEFRELVENLQRSLWNLETAYLSELRKGRTLRAVGVLYGLDPTTVRDRLIRGTDVGSDGAPWSTATALARFGVRAPGPRRAKRASSAAG